MIATRAVYRRAPVIPTLFVLSVAAIALRLALTPIGRTDLVRFAFPLLIAAGFRWAVTGRLREATPYVTGLYIASLLLGGLAALTVPHQFLGVALALTLILATEALFGRKVVLKMLAPCFGLLFVGVSVDLPADSIFALQRALAAITASVLSIAEAGIIADGARLCWPGGEALVAPECCGVNTWCVMLVWSWFFVCVGDFSARRSFLFISTAGGLAAVCITLRIIALAALARWAGTAALDGPGHDLTGILVFMALWGVLLALWWRWQPTSHLARLRRK